MKKTFIAFALMLTMLIGGGTLYNLNAKPVAKNNSVQMVAEQDPWGNGIVAPITPCEQDPWGNG